MLLRVNFGGYQIQGLPTSENEINSAFDVAILEKKAVPCHHIRCLEIQSVCNCRKQPCPRRFSKQRPVLLSISHSALIGAEF